ncbi:sulfatase-like hydrolase/transferase [Haloferula helveola]
MDRSIVVHPHPGPMRVAIACWLTSLHVVTLHAAPIVWGTPTAVSTGAGNSSDVSTNGTLVEAINALSTGDPLTNTTINGVLFTGSQSIFSEDPASAAGVDLSSGTNGGDPGYDTMLSTVDYGAPASQTVSIGGGALSVGAEYEIQIWFVDDRASTDGRVMRFGDGLGNNVDLNDQFVIGSFTADATSQTLFAEAQGFARAHISGYQLRLLPSGPPPAPETPTGLVATSGDTEVALDWDDNSQYGFANFIVRRSTSPGGPYVDVPGATPSESEFTDTGLTNGVTYYYVVAAENTEDDVSSDSTEASATPMAFVPDPPQVPTGLTANAGNDLVTLNWDDNTQPGFLEFRIKRGTGPGGPYSQIGTSGNSGFADDTAINGNTYYYVVTAVNIDAVESAPSDEASATPSVSASPPNFLFIITDDQDTFSVGAYRRSEPAEPDGSGNPYVIDTPNIDRLADEGMLFHQARLMGSEVGAVCTASRTCIMTGRSTWQRTNGMTAALTFPGIFNRGVRSSLPDLPYATYRTCKSGNSYPTANNEFTIVNDASKRGNTDGSGSEWHADRTLEHIDHWRANHQPNGKPFLMYLGFSHPHDERNARTNPNLTGRYGCINTTSPGSLTVNPAAPPIPFNHLPVNATLGTPANYPFHPFDHGHFGVRDEVNVAGVLEYRNEAVIRNEIGRNFACVDWIDRQLGRVLAKLEDPDGDGDNSDSVINNTYIVFTADHGIAVGRHGLMGKQNLYEHSWRVPFIVRGPGIAAGNETDALIYLHDTFPTFCDLAGIALPSTIDGNDGASFRPVLEGMTDVHRDYVYGLYAGGDKPGMRSVTDGRFKLIRYDVGNNATQVTQLFDLEENPFELLPEHGVPGLAEQTSHCLILRRLEEALMTERVKNADPYAFLGDRVMFRFDNNLTDRMPFGHDAAPGPSAPAFSSEIPFTTDPLLGEPNAASLEFDASQQDYLTCADGRELDFGSSDPFTVSAWVKLRSLPTGANTASSAPLAVKKPLGSADSELDYMFLAAAGSYGNATTYGNLALHLGSSIVTSQLSIPDTNWHFVSVALDPVANTARFTLDDQVDVVATSATGTANSGPLIIGAHLNSSNAVDRVFDGWMDELTITNGVVPVEQLHPLFGLPEVGPFRVLSLTRSETALELEFESRDDLLYDVEFSESLEGGSWTTLKTFIGGSASGGSTVVSDLPLPSSATGFYRVRSYPPADGAAP